MSVNYNTLNNLYNNRVLDYVPTELINTAPVNIPVQSAMSPCFDNDISVYADYSNYTPYCNANNFGQNFSNAAAYNQYNNSYQNYYEQNNNFNNNDNVQNTNSKKLNPVAKSCLKGLATLGLIIGTGYLMFRKGKKIAKPQQTSSANSSFWNKLKFWKKK